MGQKQLKFRVEEELCRKWELNRFHNRECPFYNWVGNDAAYRRLARVAFAALGRDDHQCSDFSFAILGPSSTGKTTLARMFAQQLKIPFVEIQPKSVNEVHDVFTKIVKGCEEAGIELKHIPEEWWDYDGPKPAPDVYLPPMVVFIDEVHALKNGVVQGLLNAVESRDRIMQTEPKGEKKTGYRVNCSRVCWIVATTERGQLFGPFDSRFVKIQLDYYTRDEIAEIVGRACPELDKEACRLVAKFASHMPREALDFAREMMVEREMSQKDWAAAAAQVAKDRGIDEFGMSLQRLKILVALGQGPLSKNRVCLEANCQVEELEKYVMPVLLSDLSGDPALVATSTRGYCLTRAGLAELDKRGIANRGEDAIPNGGDK